VPVQRKHQGCAPRLQVIGLLFALLAAGCSAKTFDEAPAPIPPARPAQSPPLAQAPAGVVHPLDRRSQAAIVDGRTAQLVILAPGSTDAASASLIVLGSAQTPQRVVDLPGPAAGLAGDNNGTAYLPTRGGYFVVDLAAGRAERVSVSDADNVDFTAITRRLDGALVLGTVDGTLYTLTPGATSGKRTCPHRFPCSTGKHRRGVGPRADVGHHGRRRRQNRAIVARRPGSDNDGRRSGRPIAGDRHPRG